MLSRRGQPLGDRRRWEGRSIGIWPFGLVLHERAALRGAHGIARAVLLGVLILAGIAVYGLLLALFGVIGWNEAVSAFRQSPARDLRD